MKNFLFKRIDSLNYRLISILGIILAIISLCLTALFLESLGVARRSVTYALVILGIFITTLFYMGSIVLDYRKKQIAWLKKNGKKIYGVFIRVGYSVPYDWSERRWFWELFVKSILPSGSKVFKSDQSENARTDRLLGETQKRVTQIVENYVVAHPEGIAIYINPQHPNVYWVDNSWFVTTLLNKN